MLAKCCGIIRRLSTEYKGSSLEPPPGALACFEDYGKEMEDSRGNKVKWDWSFANRNKHLPNSSNVQKTLERKLVNPDQMDPKVEPVTHAGYTRSDWKRACEMGKRTSVS